MASLEFVESTPGVPTSSGPLSSLAGNAKSLVDRYPLELGSSGKNSKNHYVIFNIKNIQPTAYNNAGTPGIKINGDAKTFYEEAAGATGLAKAVTAGSVSPIVDAAAVALTAEVLNNVQDQKNGIQINPKLTNIAQTICLYMPDTLTASYSANYEEMSLTSDIGPLITTLRAIESSGVDGKSIIKSLRGQGNDKGVNPAAIQALVGFLGTSGFEIPGVDIANLGTLLQKAQGYALNPQLQMVYRGTSLRSFDLNFTFTPKSKKEADIVNGIINKFRFYSLPSLGLKNGNGLQNGLFLVPPSVFNLQFFVNGLQSNVLPRYGDCILESIQVNHAPNGFSVFNDGSMVQTELSLSFKELDILTRDNFQSTY